MAPAKSHITCAIDFGSSFLRASFRSNDDYSTRMVQNWHTSDFFDSSGNDMTIAGEEFPTSIRFLEDPEAGKKFSIGYHLGETVFSGLKAALDPEMSKDGAGAIFRDKCASLDIDYLDIFNALMSRAVQAAETTFDGEFPDGWDWEKLIITLPVLWTQGNSRSKKIQALYRKALEEAGVPGRVVYLESEAEASVGFCARHESFQKFVRNGAAEYVKIIVMDIGEGTWDGLTCTVKSSDGEFAQIGTSIGGQGGMGSVWTKVKEKCDDPDVFGQVQSQFFRMKEVCAIKNGVGVSWSEDEVQEMMNDAWNPVLNAIRSKLERSKVRKIVLTGSAATQNHLVRTMVNQSAKGYGADTYYLSDSKPSTIVCKGAVIPWDPWNPITKLQNSALGLAVREDSTDDSSGGSADDGTESGTDDGSESGTDDGSKSGTDDGSKSGTDDGSESDSNKDLLMISKERGKSLGKLQKRGESIFISPRSDNVTIWPVYTEEETTVLADKVSTETNKSAHAFSKEATYMDPLNLPLPYGEYDKIFYRFSYDESMSSTIFLDIFNDFFHSQFKLKITRDRFRVLFELENKDVQSSSEELFQRFAIKSSRVKGKDTKVLDSQLLRDKAIHMVKLNPTTTHLEIRCLAPIHKPHNSTKFEPADGFRSCLELELPLHGEVKKLRLVSLDHDEGSGFDLLLVADHNLLHWGLEWTKRDGTLRVSTLPRRLIQRRSEPQDDSPKLKALFDLIQRGRLVATQLVEVTKKINNSTWRGAGQSVDNEDWMNILNQPAQGKRRSTDANLSIPKKKTRNESPIDDAGDGDDSTHEDSLPETPIHEDSVRDTYGVDGENFILDFRVA